MSGDGQIGSFLAQIDSAWLAALAQIKRDAAADALEEAAEVWLADPESVGDNDRDARNWLRDRADVIRSGATS